MFSRPKSLSSPSDAQASEKLALYVYEYLVYSGAQKAAQTFLQEIGWEKHIVPNEAPGFLFSWWSVFWDLYCAAPERRDALKHSSDARAFYDYGPANSGFVPSGPQPTLITGPGLYYVQGRNGPLTMPQHQQDISQPRHMYPLGIPRTIDVKIPGLVSMGEQHLEAFFSSSSAVTSPAFRPNANIATLPIASTPTVTLRHQPRPLGPLVNNGNAFGSLNSSSTASASFSGSSASCNLQPGLHQQQFGRPHPFQQQRSLPLKMSPCMLSSQQPQWSPDLSHPVDFLSNTRPAIKSESASTPTHSMLFDPAFMEQLSSVPESQPPPLHSSNNLGDGFTFFDQTDGLSVEEPAVSSVGQPVSSQISQLLSPSPVHQTLRSEATQPKVASIEETLLLTATELDMLASSDDVTGVVDGQNQLISGPLPPCQVFDSEQIKSMETSSVLFHNNNDLRT